MIGSNELRYAGRTGIAYSPRGVALTSKDDFISDDMSAVAFYNTDVFCHYDTGVIPVYTNLADIPASTLPNHLLIKITDEAYPLVSEQLNANFRLEYLGIGGRPGELGVGQPIGFVWWWFLMKVAAVVVVSLAIRAVVCEVINLVVAWRLPGGASGHEWEIDDTHKGITLPDGSGGIWDTEKGEWVSQWDKPDVGLMDYVIPIMLGVAGVAGIYVFVKYGMPAISRAAKPKHKLGAG